MDPKLLLESLCDERGLPYADASSLLPLVRRATHLSIEARKRVLRIVTAALDRRVRKRAERARELARMDDQCLSAIAIVLHGWEPIPDDADPTAD